jgi:hypothetical protein
MNTKATKTINNARRFADAVKATDQFVATVASALDIERFADAAGAGTFAQAIKARLARNIREAIAQASVEAEVLHHEEAEMLADMED